MLICFPCLEKTLFIKNIFFGEISYPCAVPFWKGLYSELLLISFPYLEKNILKNQLSLCRSILDRNQPPWVPVIGRFHPLPHGVVIRYLETVFLGMYVQFYLTLLQLFKLP